jgi:protein CrcB
VIKLLLVGAGGFLGSLLRYLASEAVQSAARHVHFPWGTLAVNTVGCLLTGFLTGLAAARGLFSLEQRLFLITGFLGEIHDLFRFRLRDVLPRESRGDDARGGERLWAGRPRAGSGLAWAPAPQPAAAAGR